MLYFILTNFFLHNSFSIKNLFFLFNNVSFFNSMLPKIYTYFTRFNDLRKYFLKKTYLYN